MSDASKLEDALNQVANFAIDLYRQQTTALGREPNAQGAMLAALYACCHATEPQLQLDDWNAFVPRLCDFAARVAPDFEVPASRQVDFASDVAAFALGTLRALYSLRTAWSRDEDDTEPKRDLVRLYRRALVLSLRGDEPQDTDRVAEQVEDATNRCLALWWAVQESAQQSGEQ